MVGIIFSTRLGLYVWDLGREYGLLSDLEKGFRGGKRGKILNNAFVTIGVFGPWNAWQRQSTLSLDRLFV